MAKGFVKQTPTILENEQWMGHSDSEEEEYQTEPTRIQRRTGIDKILNDVFGILIALFSVSFQVPIYLLMFVHHISCWIFDLIFPLFGEFQSKTWKQISLHVLISFITFSLMFVIPILHFQHLIHYFFSFYFILISLSYLLEFSTLPLEKLIDEEKWVKTAFMSLGLFIFHASISLPFYFTIKYFV
jgi:hypothetical protein